jgi:hypothetical protein
MTVHTATAADASDPDDTDLVTGAGPALRIDADGGLILLAFDYDEVLLELVRALPDRYFRSRERDWAMPARTANLRALAQLIADACELDVGVDLSRTASARLRRLQLAIVTVDDDGALCVRGPYSETRLRTLRALPDARFDPAAKTWTMPLHRAEAIAVRALIARGEAVAGPHASSQLAQTARAREGVAHRLDAEAGTGRSPAAHWRYHLPGNPVYDAGNLPRIEDPERGWCVRVWVRPRPPAGSPER